MERQTKTILMLLFIFLVLGIIIGFMGGAYRMQAVWECFNDRREAQIEQFCDCDYNYRVGEFDGLILEDVPVFP